MESKAAEQYVREAIVLLEKAYNEEKAGYKMVPSDDFRVGLDCGGIHSAITILKEFVLK